MELGLYKKLAIETAKTSNNPVYRIGAVLVGKDGCIAKPTLASKIPRVRGVCAETRILRKLPRSFNRPGNTLFVCRLNRLGQLSMSRPCVVCQAWMKVRGVQNVWYTNTNGEWVFEVFL